MFRLNSLSLIFLVSTLCSASAFGQREVSNFPTQLKDAAINSKVASEAMALRPWLKDEMDRPVGKKRSTRTAKLQKPATDSTTFQAPTETVKPSVAPVQRSTSTEEMRREIEEKVRLELEQKYQAQIQELVKQQAKPASADAPRVKRRTPLRITGQVLPIVPAKGYLLTDYTLQNKAPGSASEGTLNVNVGNSSAYSRPVTATINDESKLASSSEPTAQSTRQSYQPLVFQNDENVPPEPEGSSVLEPAAKPSVSEAKNTTQEDPSLPRVGQNQSLPLPFEQEQTSLTVKPKVVLRSSVVGPEFLPVGSAETFEILIENNSITPAADIIVQLTVPDAITISRLDRAAYLDKDNRTISWRVAKIAGNSKEIIQYKATSLTTGRYKQLVSLGMNDAFQSVTPFTTVVSKTPSTNSLPTQPAPAKIAQRPTLVK